MAQKVMQQDGSGWYQQVSVVGSGDAAGGDLTGTYPSPTLIATGTAGTYSTVTTDANGRVTSGSTTPIGVTVTATNSSGSTIATNKAVNLYLNAGVLTMRLADQGTTNNFPAKGFTIASVLNSATGTVQTFGTLSGFSALTIGAEYFVDTTTAGAIVVFTTPAASARIQAVGWAVSATQLFIAPDRAGVPQ